jgi:hypothetical protein
MSLHYEQKTLGARVSTLEPVIFSTKDIIKGMDSSFEAIDLDDEIRQHILSAINYAAPEERETVIFIIARLPLLLVHHKQILNILQVTTDEGKMKLLPVILFLVEWERTTKNPETKRYLKNLITLYSKQETKIVLAEGKDKPREARIVLQDISPVQLTQAQEDEFKKMMQENNY